MRCSPSRLILALAAVGSVAEGSGFRVFSELPLQSCDGSSATLPWRWAEVPENSTLDGLCTTAILHATQDDLNGQLPQGSYDAFCRLRCPNSQRHANLNISCYLTRPACEQERTPVIGPFVIEPAKQRCCAVLATSADVVHTGDSGILVSCPLLPRPAAPALCEGTGAGSRMLP